MGKLKQYGITTLINGVEVNVVCITSSKKKLAVLLDKPYNYILDYCSEYGFMYDECFENPSKLFIVRGMGGETLDIFEKDVVYEYETGVEMIESHRVKYPSKYDWYEKRSTVTED